MLSRVSALQGNQRRAFYALSHHIMSLLSRFFGRRILKSNLRHAVRICVRQLEPHPVLCHALLHPEESEGLNI